MTDDSFEDHRWFTPSPTEDTYLKSFQSFYALAGHVHLVYDSTRTSATVEILTSQRDDDVILTYVFDGVEQESSTKSFTSSDKGPVTVSIYGNGGELQIDLDPIDFMWSNPDVVLVDSSGDYRNGQKGAIVELFMWPHTEVEKECAMLAKMGYLGAKLFPAQEQVMSLEPFSNDLNPWYFAYQPVSYRLQGRMGTRDELRQTINTCRSLGVRMYADAVINHMTGGGNDANPYHINPNANCAAWGLKNSSLTMNSMGTATADGKSMNRAPID